MTTFELPGPINGGQLVSEILAATGVDVSHTYALTSPTTLETHDVSPQIQSAITAVIAAHVANADWAPSTEEMEDRVTLRAISGDFSGLKTKAKQVYAGTGTFTNAQSQKILAALVLRALRNL